MIVTSRAQVSNSTACFGMPEEARSGSDIEAHWRLNAAVYCSARRAALAWSLPSTAARSSRARLSCAKSACALSIGIITGVVLEEPLQQRVLVLELLDQRIGLRHLVLQIGLQGG